ncbi:MAG: ABC transporter ATP-binding protein [Patescibacteria group bacterium]|jgi:ABC-2 type transport system ATP-binding protein
MLAVEVKNLTKHFGKTRAVDDISFAIDQGEVFGFLGPNGAGKTTTIRCMMDFIRPTSGSIVIVGKNAQQESVEMKKHVGYLSGYVHLYPKWTGQEHIDFIKKLNGTKDISNELITRLDFNPSLKTKDLSSGNRQKLGVIMSLMTKPEILILDEPTNALDPLLQREVYKLLLEARDQGATIFMSSHNLTEVDRVCSRVGVIRKGKMVAVEKIENMKRKRIYTIRVSFAGAFDVKTFRLPGVEIGTPINNELVLHVKGELDPIVKKLALHTIHDIEIEHATLEDIFMEYYQ